MIFIFSHSTLSTSSEPHRFSHATSSFSHFATSNRHLGSCSEMDWPGKWQREQPSEPSVLALFRQSDPRSLCSEWSCERGGRVCKRTSWDKGRALHSEKRNEDKARTVLDEGRSCLCWILHDDSRWRCFFWKEQGRSGRAKWKRCGGILVHSYPTGTLPSQLLCGMMSSCNVIVCMLWTQGGAFRKTKSKVFHV